MQKSNYKLIIFDLDGTLINSVADLAAATNHTLRHFGMPQHEEDAYRYFVGNGVNKLLYRALPDEYKSDEWVQKMRSVMLPYYSAHCTDRTAPYEGIAELLDSIVEAGIKVAVASNKYQEATTAMVAHYFGSIPFVAVLGQRQEVPVKPDPTIVYDILSIADVKSEDALYVGDTAVDMQTARNSNITAVGVTWGFRPRTELEAEQPAHIVDEIDELRRIIFQTPI